MNQTGPATFGVEEEFLVVEAGRGRPLPAGDEVVDRANEQLPDDGDFGDDAVEHEFKREQAELGSLPCTTATELRAQLVELRSAMAAGAAASGAAVAAIGTSPFRVRPTATADERYERMTAEFGLLARQSLTCGQHVHVEVGSRDEGAGVIDRLPPFLPVLLALSANSPWWQGEDSGYASFRSAIWGLWPTAGPSGPFGDAAGYDAAVAQLVATGSALDEGMVYFDARLSAKYPTVEVRVADVCTDVDDAVLIAVLVRALVTTTSRAWAAGDAVEPSPPQWQRAATWRAARYGLTGSLVDPVSRDLVPAADAVSTLVDAVGDALDAIGERDLVADGLDRLLRTGTGADRQRRVHATTGSRAAVMRDAIARTASA
ncbi:carboxylate-amine ligase [Micropruina sonneratiae]|uniref:carboxylate-amine ligase n=1 Tax=Micropruina sonneratiae TaxID=2986940 RepID=UPI00222790EF|nr:glutamate--cysteine ligase [Micropruina sp. KQZ13P-5]MCW3159068.1 glutamate--cysteine ligase [Micropruina sp. KQZ13P-5]